LRLSPCFPETGSGPSGLAAGKDNDIGVAALNVRRCSSNHDAGQVSPDDRRSEAARGSPNPFGHREGGVLVPPRQLAHREYLIRSGEEAATVTVGFGLTKRLGHEVGRFEGFGRSVADHDLSGADDYWESGIKTFTHSDGEEGFAEVISEFWAGGIPGSGAGPTAVRRRQRFTMTSMAIPARTTVLTSAGVRNRVVP
jgi:hypothetical protein